MPSSSLTGLSTPRWNSTCTLISVRTLRDTGPFISLDGCQGYLDPSKTNIFGERLTVHIIKVWSSLLEFILEFHSGPFVFSWSACALVSDSGFPKFEGFDTHAYEYYHYPLKATLFRYNYAILEEWLWLSIRDWAQKQQGQLYHWDLPRRDGSGAFSCVNRPCGRIADARL